MSGNSLGDWKGQNVARMLGSLAKGLEKQYPRIVQALGQQAIPAAEYEIGAQEMVAPREAKLMADLYSQFAPQYAESGAAAELGALRGSGGAAVRETDRLSREIDPEYYAGRATTASKLQALLGGMDPNRLTGGEREDVARGLARSGYGSGELAVPSNQGAIEAALTYGSALQNKKNTVANAINTASGALPQFRSNVDVFGQGTGRAGTAVFGQAAPGLGRSPTAMYNQQLGGQIAGIGSQFELMKQQLKGQARTAYDAVNQSYTAATSGTASAGAAAGAFCWILQEYYNDLPWYVNSWRHNFHNPSLARAYNELSIKAIPLIRAYPEFKEWVRINFVLPIVQHAKELYA